MKGAEKRNWLVQQIATPVLDLGESCPSLKKLKKECNIFARCENHHADNIDCKCARENVLLLKQWLRENSSL